MALQEALEQNGRSPARRGREEHHDRPATKHGERREHELARRYHQDGDQAAKDQLIDQLLPLAQGLAKRYKGPDTSVDDLLQVACIGLVKAIDRFDSDRGTAVSSFAVRTVLTELRGYLRENTWSLHVSRDRERIVQVSQLADTLTSRLGRSPTPAEIAQATGDSTEAVVETLEAASAYDSPWVEANCEAEQGDSERLASHIGGHDGPSEVVEGTASIFCQLEGLPKRERQVLALRLVDDMTQTEIAERMGVSQMHVSRLIRRALERIHAGHENGLQTVPTATHASGSKT